MCVPPTPILTSHFFLSSFVSLLFPRCSLKCWITPVKISIPSVDRLLCLITPTGWLLSPVRPRGYVLGVHVYVCVCVLCVYGWFWVQLSVNMMSFLTACTDLLGYKCRCEHIQPLHTLRCFSSHSERLDIDFHNKQECQQKPFGGPLKISSSLKFKSNLVGCELESAPCSHPAFVSRKQFLFLSRWSC